jgi:hypothetical protein
MVNWKFYLDKKKMSLQGFIDDHKIENFDSAKTIFTKIGVTSPQLADFETSDSKWFSPVVAEPEPVEVVNISKRRQGGRTRQQ